MTDSAARPVSADVRVGPPAFARVVTVGFALVWIGVITSFAVRGDGGIATYVVVPLMLVFGLAVCWRNTVQGLRSDGDELVIRGPFTTRRVARQEIADVTRGESSQFPGTPCLVVTTRDHRSLGAPPLTTLPFGARAREQAEEQVAQVRAWAGLTG